MVSIIIRNRNEGEYIGFTLQSIMDFIPDSQVIILDNNSTDDSLEVVGLYNDKLNIEIDSITQYTPGLALNYGVKKCVHDIVLILSGHSQITKMDIPFVKTKLQEYSAVFGKQTPIYKGRRIYKRYIWSHFKDKDIPNMWSNIEDRHFLHNAFCFYNKKHLIETPFDESLPGKEDRYWAKDIIKKDQSYFYTPSIEVNHYYTRNGATWKGIG